MSGRLDENGIALETAIERYLHEQREACYMLLRRYIGLGRQFLLRSDILDECNAFCAENPDLAFEKSPLYELIQWSQEAAIEAPWIYIAIRSHIARWNYYRIHAESLHAEALDVSDFLAFKERLINGIRPGDDWTMLEFDIGPFSREFPKLRESRSIGRGVEFLNRRLSSQLFQELGKGDQRLLDFLSMHQCQGQQLMVNSRINGVAELRQQLRSAEDYLARQPDDAE